MQEKVEGGAKPLEDMTLDELDEMEDEEDERILLQYRSAFPPFIPIPRGDLIFGPGSREWLKSWHSSRKPSLAV